LTSLRANGSRERAPDDRLREAIQLSACRAMDCFASARNDGVAGCLTSEIGLCEATVGLPGAGLEAPGSRSPAYKRPRICYAFSRAPPVFNRREGRNAMAKGQMRSNKEKKKPKADKNLKKGGVAPVNPFATGKTPAGQSPNSNKK
jgi:hypothetical protein